MIYICHFPLLSTAASALLALSDTLWLCNCKLFSFVDLPKWRLISFRDTWNVVLFAYIKTFSFLFPFVATFNYTIFAPSGNLTIQFRRQRLWVSVQAPKLPIFGSISRTTRPILLHFLSLAWSSPWTVSTLPHRTIISVCCRNSNKIDEHLLKNSLHAFGFNFTARCIYDYDNRFSAFSLLNLYFAFQFLNA